MTENEEHLLIVEAVLELHDPERHREIMAWITSDKKRSQVYAGWRRFLDEAFPETGDTARRGFAPPDVLARVERRIDLDDLGTAT